jgi:isocitrate dehydrogenase (NAD+)
VSTKPTLCKIKNLSPIANFARKLVDGLFLDCCREVAEKFPQIEYEEMIVDNTCMQLVKNPQQFDVMVMPSLYGSIITSIGAGLTGGPGVTSGATLGNDFYLFEQGTRNSGEKITGEGIANPSALLYSSVNMLRSMGFPRYGDLISNALFNVYSEGQVLTPDVGGNATTQQFTDRVIQEIQKLDGKN